MDPDVNAIRHVIAHWGCADPELRLIPPSVFFEVEQLVASSSIAELGKSLSTIELYADGLHMLMKYDSNINPGLACQGMISPNLATLLTRSLAVAKQGLKAVTSDLDKECITKPYENPFQGKEFEEMARTGSWFPKHPVIRLFPWFWYDNVAMEGRLARKLTKETQHKEEVLKQRKEDAESYGITCRKHTCSNHGLVPGMFTVFCGGCGACEGFEIMPIAESPATAFQIFTQRAWVDADYVKQEWYNADKIWADII